MDDAGAGFLAAIAVRTALVFFFLVLAVRWTGKRQTGEMNVHDLLMVMILANAVQNSMTQGNGRLGVALVSSGTLIVIGWLLASLRARHPFCQEWVAGAPTVIVEDGRKIERNMRREGLSEEDLMEAVRDQGLADLAKVKLAVLEIDGVISVIPRERAREG